MITLSQVGDVAITLFAIIYTIGLFWRPNRMTKRKVFGDTLKKARIDLWSMEMNQAVTQDYRKEVMKEKKDLETQIKEIKEILAEEEKELIDLKAEKKVNWDECKKR